MKNIKKALLGLLSFFFLSQFVLAQTLEGVISYSIEYEVVQDDRMDLEIYKAMIPHKMELSLKGANSHLKFVGGMTQGLLGDILYQSKEKNLYSIMDFNKTVTKTSVEELTQGMLKTGFKAQKTSDTASVLGYFCAKYVVKDEKEGTETSLWCTKSISNASASVMVFFLQSMTQFGVSGVEGLPLKIQFKGKEFDLTLLANNKEQKQLPATLFEIPKGYKLNNMN